MNIAAHLQPPANASGVLTFVLVVPTYNPASNGIMLFYGLTELLLEAGHTTILFPLNSKEFVESRDLHPSFFLTRFQTDAAGLPADAIAIFPDTTPAELADNLPCRRRVWYLLNKPGLLTGRLLPYRPEDAVIAYSGLVSPLYYQAFFNRRFTDFDPHSASHAEEIRTKRDLILIYYGKSRPLPISRSIRRFLRESGATIICIHRFFPASREQLYSLLKQARLVISYDPLTNLNYEATLCGTPCFVADNYMGIRYEDYNVPLHGLFCDESRLRAYYRDGLPAETRAEIARVYHDSIGDHPRRAADLVNHCLAWFDLVHRAKADPALQDMLVRHNLCRREIDRLYLQGKTPVDSKFQNFSPTIGWRDWLYHTWERYRWYVFRDLKKYVLRLPADQLAAEILDYRKLRARRYEDYVQKRIRQVKSR